MLFKDVYNCPCIACVFEPPFLLGQNTRRFSIVYNTLTIRMLYNLLRKTMRFVLNYPAITFILARNLMQIAA